MPPKKYDTIWEAPPHTIAKIAILENYLQAWFQIMGRSKKGQDLLYVDGFAGPGEYTNHARGSPIAALASAQSSIASLGSGWTAGKVRCAFIEMDNARFMHLKERIKPFENSPGLEIHTLNLPFVDGLADLKSRIPIAFRGSYPLFVFIDPFGATGAPFSAVADILASPCSEVLINLDADGIARIFYAQEGANHQVLLDEILGNNSWAGILSKDQPFPVLCRQVLGLYKASLRSLSMVRYVFAFEMRACDETLNYYLVFASQHPLGLEKMKEAMKRIDQDGDYCFSDASLNQPALFRFDDPAVYSPRLHEHFRGRAVVYSELRDYALNETPFINPKSMLKDLEAKDLIQVIGRDAKRRRGTFNEDKLMQIVFV